MTSSLPIHTQSRSSGPSGDMSTTPLTPTTTPMLLTHSHFGARQDQNIAALTVAGTMVARREHRRQIRDRRTFPSRRQRHKSCPTRSVRVSQICHLVLKWRIILRTSTRRSLIRNFRRRSGPRWGLNLLLLLIFSKVDDLSINYIFVVFTSVSADSKKRCGRRATLSKRWGRMVLVYLELCPIKFMEIKRCTPLYGSIAWTTLWEV